MFLRLPGTDTIGNTTQSQSQFQFRTLEFGVDLRPGILLSPITLLYGRIGAAFNDLQLQTNVQQTMNAAISGSLFTGTSTLALSADQAVTGLRLGAGLEQFLNKNFSLRADYLYTRYGRINNSGATSSKALFASPLVEVITVDNGFTGNTQTNVSSQTALLAIDYYFSPQTTATSWFNAIDYATAVQNFNGFFMGLKVGAIQTRADIHALTSIFSNSLIQNSPLFNQILNTTAAWQNKPCGTIFAGYDRLIGNTPLHLGTEVFIDAASHQLGTSTSGQQQVSENFPTTTTLINSVKIRLNSLEYGVDFKPGILLATQTLFYGRIGAAFNKIKINSNSSMVFRQDNDPFLSSSLNLHQNKNITALRLGVGLEQAIRHHLGINLDYVYTDYGDIDLSGFTKSSPPLSPDDVFTLANASKATNISSQNVTLGITYHFG